jgi:hypothetical protein
MQQWTSVLEMLTMRTPRDFAFSFFRSFTAQTRLVSADYRYCDLSLYYSSNMAQVVTESGPKEWDLHELRLKNAIGIPIKIHIYEFRI